jgi:hypothetical protein
MISLEERKRKTIERVNHVSNDPKFPLLGIINLLWFPRRNQLMNKGPVVEPSTTPMNGSMV